MPIGLRLRSDRRSSLRRAAWLTLAVALLAGAGAVAALAQSPSNSYQQVNLVSDIPGVARITDPNLVNPWGLAASATSPLWVADNGSGVSTLYTGAVNGSIPVTAALVVKIPGGDPTGTVLGDGSAFVVKTPSGSAPANFIFDSESGRITAWSGKVSGTKASTEFFARNAVYKGLATDASSGSTFLYATNFRQARIDVFDGRFHKLRLPGGAFTDPGIPAGFAPFGIQNIAGRLYVSYAKQDGAKHDDVAGAGNGFVDVYSADGVLQTRLISAGALNSPWGMVVAPGTFGPFAGDLLVANFGDGTIHAYDPVHGTPEGELLNPDGNPIAIDGLWSLRFGNGTFATAGTLVFTAGIAAESHGLLGEIAPTG